MIASAIRSVIARVGISAINGIQLPMVPILIFSRVSRFTARKIPLAGRNSLDLARVGQLVLRQ
jgi:hypothetical protein